MKLRLSWVVSAVVVVASMASGQGTFIYDQESSSEGMNGEFSVNILSNQPLGQSFRPGLGSLDFVRLYFINGGVGGSAYLNLRSNSIDGPIIATSQSVTLPDAYKGYSNFFFPSSVPLVAGDVYVFQPVILSGTGWLLNYHNGFAYAQGAAIFGGVQQTVNDLWFREGQYVPEPSVAMLGLLGIAGLAWARWKRFPRT